MLTLDGLRKESDMKVVQNLMIMAGNFSVLAGIFQALAATSFIPGVTYGYWIIGGLALMLLGGVFVSKSY